jgi:CubicO group peptidase (beta-lactamase class C family)
MMNLRSAGFRRGLPKLLLIAALAAAAFPSALRAEPQTLPTQAVEQRIQALIPEFETYIRRWMKDFDLPGLAVGVVAGDKLVYAKGFGVRSRKGGEPVDSKTIFQIGSTTKAFLATAIGIMVDRGKLNWDDRIVDLHPDFQLMDPWVTREFRVFDLLAQRSGLPPYANDGWAILGFGEDALIRSLRYVEPVTSFRTTFAYTNLTHLLAGQVVAKAAGLPDGDAVIRKELLEPLGMKDTSSTLEAMKASPNRAEGHRWAPSGSVEIPFTQTFPYDFGGAGNINSNIEDMARWMRLQLGFGVFEGRRIVSTEALAFTRTPKVAISDKTSYAYGWGLLQTPNGTLISHNGSTGGYGTFVGFVPDKDVGVVALSNQEMKGLPAAVAVWLLDRLAGNPIVDYAPGQLKDATAAYDKLQKRFVRPDDAMPSPPLASLAGTYSHPGAGRASVTSEGDALTMTLEASGAKLKLEPWNGDILIARLLAEGSFADVAATLGPSPAGFVQFQSGNDGKLDLLRLNFQENYQDNNQAFDFKRE